MLAKGIDWSLDKRQLCKFNHGVACRLNGLVCVQTCVFAVCANQWFNLHANEYTVMLCGEATSVIMRFYPYQSIEIPRQEKNRLIANDKESLKCFWETVEEIEEGLSQAIGVYIFSIRAGKGNVPWYVGKAEKQAFIKECFQHHKLTHYNNRVASKKGTPLLTLIPKFTQHDYLVQPSGYEHPDISTLEKMLIGTCLKKNPKLANARDTKLHHKLTLPGYINTPQGGIAGCVKEFKALLGV